MIRLSKLKHRVAARMSLAARVAVITAAAVGATLALVSAVIFFLVRAEFESSMDESLLNRANAAVEKGITEDVINGIPNDALVLADVQIAVVRGGSLFGGSNNSKLLPYIGVAETAVAADIDDSSIRSVKIRDSWYRVAAVHSGPNTALVIAQSMESIRRALDQLVIILLTTSLLGVVVAGLTGWAVARRGLRPVRRLTQATEDVARTGKLEPIAVSGTKDLARLTNSFNTMLRALDAAQTQQRQLVADAGHELRTPLTSLRTNVELFVQSTENANRSLSEEARDELLADMRAQVTELSNLIGDLVELARDESDYRDPEPVDLAEIVEASVARVQLRATSLKFDVRVQSWPVLGERDLLERAITNILDNAAKWSPEFGVITVRLESGRLTISDQGPGISEEDLPKVFERFYRSSEARTLPGSGLGLSIAKSAVDRHGGVISIMQVQPHGTSIAIDLPRAPRGLHY